MDEGCGPKSSNLSKYVSVLPSPRGLFFIKKDQLGQNWPGSSSNVDSKSHFVRCYINSLSLQLKLRVPPGELTPVSKFAFVQLLLDAPPLRGINLNDKDVESFVPFKNSVWSNF
jgi:hypothetical protein